jgi:hypothetical protein
MVKRLFTLTLILCAFSAIISSCSSNDSVKIVTSAESSFTYPTGLNNASLASYSVTFTNLTTKESTTYSDLSKIQLPEGLYNVSLQGVCNYTLDNGSASTSNVRSSLENVTISEGSTSLKFKLYVYNNKAGLVLKEIFFAGTLTPAGASYNYDTYFVIYNNSDSTICADGVLLLESNFLTSGKKELTLDIMSSSFAVDAAYQIPGSGTEHPVASGDSLVICDRAIDHTSANTHSFDLSKADFEWYDESSVASSQDVDNPDVPNLNKIYSYTKSVWIPSVQGNHAYAIARPSSDFTSSGFLTNNVYNYTYPFVSASLTKTMTGSCYEVPNSWILDAVDLCPSTQWQWNVVDASLDMGYAYVGEIGSGTTNRGKSVIRKIQAVNPDGRVILQDTNNSSEDFQMGATASMIAKKSK